MDDLWTAGNGEQLASKHRIFVLLFCQFACKIILVAFCQREKVERMQHDTGMKLTELKIFKKWDN